MTKALVITRAGWRSKISQAWEETTTATVQGIIRIGEMLNQAKEQLAHGEWFKLLDGELPFTRRTAARLMRIANDERISNRTHVSYLPPHWGTLYELTRLNDKQFDRLLRKGTIRPDMERNELGLLSRLELRREDEKRIKDLVQLKGQFRTLVIDPPWDYEWLSIGGASKPGYATMTHEQLLDLPVPAWATKECHLYLWTTNNFMTRACELMLHWGFDYKTILTWIKTDKNGKPKIGLGTYYRNTTEHVLFGVRGQLRTRVSTTPTHFFAPVGRHSEKPEVFYNIVRKESYLPAGEAFQRQDRKGFVNLFVNKNLLQAAE